MPKDLNVPHDDDVTCTNIYGSFPTSTSFSCFFFQKQ